ncbi:alpha/beta hydrolase [Pseudobutyrivibrio ruminis]|uniref:alpha/beta hydrolase n=1 Tax=Pseudobutyrivibrio ruminis TaxID=46206 RepID=UPI000483977A|nr:alpha/beta hydrolase [Pseudobutyrivibrio ruminis]
MALLKLNLNDPLMIAIKAINSIGGKSLTEEDLKRQRSAMERAGKLAAPTSDVTVEEFKVKNIACEWVKPDFAHNPQYVILYAHGGGYTCGGLGYARILAAKLAVATGFSVVSFEYRLAPEHKYPAPLEDGMKIWKYLMEKGYEPNKVLLAGDSAGGNLVLCMTMKLIKEELVSPKGLILFSPWTDMTATSKSYEKYKEKDPILTKEYVEGVRNAFVGEDVDFADPKYSPLYGDFTSFPPTFIMVGRNEILLEDSVQLQKKILKAGGEAIIDIEKDGWHVYQQMPLPIATRAMKRVADYVSNIIYVS